MLRTEFDQIFGGVGRGPRTNRLDFGGNPDLDQDPRFLNPDQDLDPEFFIDQRG